MEENLALLIDFENIHAGTEKEGLGRFDVEALIDRLKGKGRILISRAFGDWGRFARFKQEMLAANVAMMELTSHGMQDKNRADIALVVDCLELAFTRDFVNTFVIVSGDSDFTPLVLKMRELNKKVIGVGTRGSTSRLLINACDEFIFYDTIVRSKAKAEPRGGGRRGGGAQATKGFNLLLETLHGMLREDPSAPLASVVKTALVRRLPDFSEEDLGFNSFTRFLEAARDAGVVVLTKDQKSGGYRVEPSEEAASEARSEAPAPRYEGRSERGDRGDRGERHARPSHDPADAPVATDGITDELYYPAGSQPVLALLAQANLAPLAAPSRLALLEALAETVTDRESKKRRITIPFVVEDIKRRLRRTHPDLQAKAIKDVLGALQRAGLLIHPKDLTPVRSANAPFVLKHGAETLNQKLTELYIGTLKKAGADLTNVSMLAELFYGNAERRRDIETAVAWAVVGEAPEASGDVDDLFLVDDEPAPTRAAPTERPPRAEAPKPARHEGAVSDLDALLEVEGAEPAAPREGRREGRRDDGRRDGRRDEGRRDGRRERAPAPPVSSLDDLFTVEDDAPAADPLDALLVEDAPLADDLFVVDEPEAAPAPEATPAEEAPAKAPRSRAARPSRAKKAAEPSAEEAPAEETPAAAEPEKKRRSPRKKKDADEG